VSERTRPGPRRFPGAGTLLRDVTLFLVGICIVVKQTGLPWLLESAAKPSVWYLAVGALFCNGPVVLQALTIWRGAGTSSPGQSPGLPSSGSPSEPSPAPSSAGE